MEALKQNTLKIIINGKNVTADVTPNLSRLGYTDKEEAESDDVILTFEDTTGNWQNGWYPETGDSLNIHLGSAENTLDCGVFEIDEIEFSYPPDTVTVKGIGTSISKALRTKNNKAFEKQTLKEIAQYFANKHKLKLKGNSSELHKIEIDRKTQERQTDISFLSGLAREYGIVFSIRGDQLVFMDTAELETQPSALTLPKKEISRAQFRDKTSQIYGAAAVSARNMKKNNVSKWTITADNNSGKATLTNDVWNGNYTAESETQAQAIAKGGLKNNNKEKITGTITVEGNPKLVAGINISLSDIGKFSGKWHVVSSSHSIDNSSGYVTDASIYKILV